MNVLSKPIDECVPSSSAQVDAMTLVNETTPSGVREPLKMTRGFSFSDEIIPTPRVTKTVSDFINNIKEMKEKHIGYNVETVRFYINNTMDCNIALSDPQNGLAYEYGDDIREVLSFLNHNDYLRNIRCAIGNHKVNGLLKTDTRILFFAIRWDIKHIFKQVMQKQNYLYLENIDLYRTLIKFTCMCSRHEYFKELVMNSVPEIKIVAKFADVFMALQATAKFDEDYNRLIHELYGIDKDYNNDSVAESPCGCLAKIKSILIESKNKNLYCRENYSITVANCRVLMMLIYFNYFEAFISEFSLFQNYETTYDVETKKTIVKILLKFSVMTNKLAFFQHIVENSERKIKFVDSLTQCVLACTENMEFLRYIFNGKCRTKNAPMCKKCDVGKTPTIMYVNHDIENYKNCENYVMKKIIV